MAKEDNTAKLKALQLTLDKLEKSYGKGAVMKLGEGPIEKIDVISSGSLTLDIALGVDGPAGIIWIMQFIFIAQIILYFKLSFFKL